ncbi:hypothetical protein CMI42_03500 [Candidatus Pacearchaeota archaeon]|nr:hypothetical protein [Candidatus Pacearchaeota archaeon]|tara:strand:+ start:949 stop:2448 length:1500 start_codon:yes stop_codon:yes gene_type:complete
MSLDKLINDRKIIAVICNQFGDTGKGKYTDYFASHWADVIARGTGGNNAGHTIILNGEEKIFHLLPAGITYDADGKTTILGNGMVIDLKSLNEELDELDQQSMSYNNLKISKDAHVVFPYHIEKDRANTSQENGGIGSTGRGIGPCYTDKIARRGITMGDLFDRQRLIRKLERSATHYPDQELDPEQIANSLEPFSERIKPFVADTVSEMHRFINQGKKVLLEGAQGLLISIEHGTYPFVTSSDCSLSGTATGVGLSARDVDLPLGIIKFPFMTRVGAGPFPTEIGGRDSESYCAKGLEHDIFYEAKEYLGMQIDLNEIRELQANGNSEALAEKRVGVVDHIRSSKDTLLDLANTESATSPIIQGAAMRLLAGEYGATTARPRRIGWTDAIAARYARRINGPYFILTKPDCLENIDEFRICTGYRNGNDTTEFRKDEQSLRTVAPTYTSHKGYGNVRNVKEFENLPPSLKNAIVDFDKFTEGETLIVSTGPESEQTIVK